MQQHRHEEFIRFLNDVERAVPAGKLIEAVVDNYATHKHPKVKAWLERHPRWTFHFTPTSGSWLNAVENFFSVLTRKRIRRGSFHSIVDLQAAIKRYLAEHNAEPKPFVWTASAASILAKLDRLPAPSLDSSHSHVRHFKQQAQKIFACFSSCSAWPPLGKAGGTIMKRRLIML